MRVTCRDVDMLDARQLGDAGMADITSILQAIDAGDATAAAKLLPLAYDELRRLARQQMARERPGHTLQATALVHEAYLRLVGQSGVRWDNRGRFFAAASEAMRRILIEHARRKLALRRGGRCARVDGTCEDIPDVALPGATPEELLDLSDALDRLGRQDQRKAELVKLTFFAGLSLDEAADALGIARSTAYRHWAFARAWLREAMESDIPGDGSDRAQPIPVEATVD